jgi:DNA-binding beta-propeller fold protein YncE/PKD repeat protein
VLVALATLVCVAPAADARRVLFASDVTGNRIFVLGVGSDGGITWLPNFTEGFQDAPTALVSGADATRLYATLPTGVRRYSVDSQGDLMALTTVAAGTGPSAAAVSPSGSRLFATNAGSGSVSRFAIGVDGVLTALLGGATTVGAGPDGVAVTPDGSHVYVANGTDGTISILDGQAAAVQGTPVPAGTGVSGLAVSPDGKHLYAANTGADTVSGWTIGTDGSLAELATSPYATGDGPRGIAISSDGSRLLTADVNDGTVGRFLVSTNGELSGLTPTTSVTGASSVTISPDAKHAYVGGSSSVAAYDLSSVATMTLRTGSPVPTSGAHSGLALTTNQAPQAKMNAVAAPAGAPSTFQGGPSLDPDGNVASWSWDFGDGSTGTGSAVTHVYAQPGSYTIRLTVIDDEGCSTSSTYTGQALSCFGSPYATSTQELNVIPAPDTAAPDPACAHDGNDGFCGTPDQKPPQVTVLGFNDGASITTLDAPTEIVGTITPDPSGIASVRLRFTEAAGTVRVTKTKYVKVCKKVKGKKKKRCKKVKRVVRTNTKVPACLTVSGTNNYLVKYLCSKVKWVTVPGDSSFRYSLPVALGTGAYTVDVVAVDGAGNTDVLEAARNHMTFKVVTTPSNADSGGGSTGTTTTTTPTTTTPITDTGSPFGKR